MANRYKWQFNGSLKPQMAQIDGFVSIGTGGQVNFPDQFGIGTPSSTSVSTGVPRGLLPGQATAGVPTGWNGGFSGVIGLLGAGVKGVQRVATGTMVMVLEDDWVRLDSIQLNIHAGTSLGTAIDWCIIDHTVGAGNTIATGGITGYISAGNNPKNTIFIKFFSTVSGSAVDLGLGSGFYVDIRVRDTTTGVQ